MSAVVVAGALALTGCIGDQPPGPTPPPPGEGEGVTSTPDPGETVVQTPLEFPEPGDAQEAAFFRMPGRELGDSSEIIGGPSTLEAGQLFRIEGQCEGTQAPFEVTSTNADDAGTVLLSGTLVCDDPEAISEMAHTLQFDSGVQIGVTDGDSVERLWLRVVGE